jgi:predicted nucleic acid-binding protein
MKKSKIYLDTSIIGYLYQETQPEKMADTHKLWNQIKKGFYDVVVSELLLEEISNTPNDEIKVSSMSIQEICEIKETLSERFWGKPADEINNEIKPNADEMKRRINELRTTREKKSAWQRTTIIF